MSTVSKQKANPTTRVGLYFPGGAERDRTADLVTASHALSHLSYSPFKISYYQRPLPLSISIDT